MESINTLKGYEKRLLTEAFCEAIKEPQSFKVLVSHYLNDITENFQYITTSNNTERIAFEFIEKAVSCGDIEKLLVCVLKFNKGNLKLKYAVAVVTFNHILKPFKPLEDDYKKQIQDLYLAHCSKNGREHNNNEHQKYDSLEKIFEYFAKAKPSNIKLEIEGLVKFTYSFLSKIKKDDYYSPHLVDYFKKWCKQIDPKLTDILKEIDNIHSSYYEALLSLNFSKQVRLFEQLVTRTSMGACIIHGEQGSGQKWLLHKLRKEIKSKYNNQNEYVIRINPKIFTPKYTNFLRQISRRLSGREQLTESQIIERISDILKTQTVIIILNDVDRILEVIQEFINRLWGKLLKKLNYPCSDVPKNNYRLFMFIIDDIGYVKQWTSANLRDNLDNNWKPDFPIKLPSIEKLSWQELNDWINNCKHILPENLSELNKSDIQSLVNEWDSGLFMTVLYEICWKCDYSLWDYIEEKCLKD